ncbi:hypothetical protein ADEAN_000521600 [Angomonas deanei]|uniref:Uncharacterized protein n=1 Tax=Angomonas deanei TaxID=59799 RepID=A0A7G2CD32_9TRYP|nr:hypothetical protein ADEAN_000521600 [Angomonas deanei]
MDSDEERSVHEEEEDEERNEARSDDEEQQETKEPEKEVDPRFLEKLPSRRESVSEVVVNLRAIHTDEEEEAAKKDAKQTPLEKINVRVVMPEDIQYDLFAKRYKKNLREMVRENVLRQLQEDVDGRRAFQQYCTEQDEALAGEGADDEEEEEAEGFEEVNRLDNPNPPPPPYWLPSLLSNDAVYVERVLAAMYGWALPPAPVLKPNKKGQSVSFGVEKSDGEAEEGEEEEEEVNEDGVRVAPVKKRLSYFHQNDAFADSVRPTDEDSEEEHDGEKEDSSSKDNSEKRIPSVHSNAGEKPVARDSGPSQSVVPLYSIPNFPYSRYVFYLCYDRNNEEWLLLSVHPRLYTLQVKNQRKEGGKEGEEEEPEEEEEEEEDEENGSGKAAARRADKSVVVVPDFDYTTLLKMDGLLLSILCCPTALRFCLLQKQSVPNSLQALEDWLRKDFIAAFPYLSTLYTALLSVRSKDEHRLPYKLPSRVLDFNLFFTPRYLSVARAAADSANKGKEELPPVLIGGAQLISKTKKEKADTLILLKQVEGNCLSPHGGGTQ